MRAREGRASPEQELAALVDANRIFDGVMRTLQGTLRFTKSPKKQAALAKDISAWLKLRQKYDKRMAELEARLREALAE